MPRNLFYFSQAYFGVALEIKIYSSNKFIGAPQAVSVVITFLGGLLLVLLALLIWLTVVNYGYPIAKLMALEQTSVPYRQADASLGGVCDAICRAAGAMT